MATPRPPFRPPSRASSRGSRSPSPSRDERPEMKRPSKPGSDTVDLTVVAVPGYFAAMGLEYWLQRRRHARGDAPTAGDYEIRDTLASLAMGQLSLVAPFVAPRLLRPVTRGQGRFAKALVGAAVGAGVVTTVADVLARRAERRGGTAGRGRRDGAAPPAAARGAVDGPRGRLGRRGGRHRRRWGRRHHRLGHRHHARTAVGAAAGPITRAGARRPGRGRRRLGLPLLLEPPVHAHQPLHVGGPRGPPLE